MAFDCISISPLRVDCSSTPYYLFNEGNIMLKSEKVILKWNSKIKKHYIDLGYKYTKMKDEFEVDVCDLTRGSSVLVDVVCDYCGKEYQIVWCTRNAIMNKTLIKKDACKDCCEIKSNESICLKYGSYLNLYNVTNESRIQTNIDKFGCENPFGNSEIQDKIKIYYLENYGVDHNMKIKECVDKAKQTNLDRYGFENYCQTSEYRESHSGEKAWNWKGDAATTIRDGRELPIYKDWRKSVFSRDKYTCQCCGVRNGNGSYIRLEAHHILNWKDNKKERYDVDNGITFCAKCHLKFHSKYGKKNNTKEQLYNFIEEQKKIDKNIC